MTISMDGHYNFTLNKGKWKYFYGIFNKSVGPVVRIQYKVSTTGPAKFFMHDMNKCPFFGDQVILETKGKAIDKTGISPFVPSSNIFTIGAYSESNNNDITLQIVHLVPPPKWRQNINKLFEKSLVFGVSILASIIFAYLITKHFLSTKESNKKTHRFQKQISKSTIGKKKVK